MSEATKVYDLGNVTCNLGGIPLDTLGGWGEGDGAIKCERQKESFTFKQGADGSVVRSKTYSKLWKVTLTLLQSAGANAVLSALLKLDEGADNGAGVVPILIRDRGGLSLLSGSEAWIEGDPATIEFGSTAKNVEWVIMVADATVFVGGN